jgi:co-chaperonin GroES (HSP10)
MIKVTKMIEPMFNRIVVTHRQYSRQDAQTVGGIFTQMEGKTMEYQKVLAVGPNAKGVKVGDIVCIDPSRYAQLLHKEGLTDIDKKITSDDMRMAAIFPLETVYTKNDDGIETSETVMVLYDSDIMYIVPEFEDFHPTIEMAPSGIIIPPGGIIKGKN